MTSAPLPAASAALPLGAPSVRSGGLPALLQSLAELTRTHPTTRKRLVGPDINFGRELLVSLARELGGWIGWDATNLRTIADELAFVPLAERNLRPIGDVEIGDLVHHALGNVAAHGLVSAGFADLGRGHGFRRALRDALLELRMAGVPSDAVEQAAVPGIAARDVAPVLAEYERLLAESRVADPAAVFALALEHFDSEAPYVLDGVVAVVPGLSLRGLPGQLLERVLAFGAHRLAVDVPDGLVAPSHLLAGPASATGSLLAHLGTLARLDEGILERVAESSDVTYDLFAATTPAEEVREVCRRVLAEGWRWDQVEVVATDPDAYGVALDALAQRLGIGVTMLRGLPLARTRIGRAVDRWLSWLEDGLPADVLRQALEAGELVSGAEGVTSTALARELRVLRIGWGRARYEAALGVLRAEQRVSDMRQADDEDDEAFAARRASRRRTGAALSALLGRLLSVTPQVPERGSDRVVRTSVAALARATTGFLELFGVHGPAEVQALERVRERLARLGESTAEEATFGAALAALRESLADLRAWPLVTSDRKPWSSAGGMLHLTDVAHAGTAGRPRTFVVGLDAELAGGPVRQDPLLPDSVRRALGASGLPATPERRAEWSFALAAALAGLRGRVTLSYSTSAALDGREAGPSPLLLQAFRLLHRDPDASYEALRDALRPPVSAVPARGADGTLAGIALLDTRDVWLDALARGPLLLDGSAPVADAFPMLAAGLRAQAVAGGADATAYHGIVPEAGAALDPMARPDREISPSSLETLARCSLAWFYRYGLALYPPTDPEFDAEAWLDALARGALLHEVFEVFTREFQGRQDALASDACRTRMLALVEDALARWRAEVPPPGETVYEVEAGELRRAALAFLQMERERAAAGETGQWWAFELGFGSEAPAGTFALPDGATLRTRGRADRVDTLPDGTLRVVDYKTGSANKYRRDGKGGAFHGGRLLQPALYAAAIAAVTGRAVSRFEYRFPTERGQNEIVGWDAGELAPARDIVGDLVAQVRAGAFVPTDDAADCAYCDYQPVCRARLGTFGAADSPRAEWAKEHAPALPMYAGLLQRRGRSASSSTSRADLAGGDDA